MPKFFVRNNQVKCNEIEIIGEDVNHITNVLRMKIGENFQICNVDTTDNYIVKLSKIDKNIVNCKIIKQVESQAESNINLSIFQGIPKSDKMELIIQKSTRS